MANFFDQFDAAPPGVAPQTEAAPGTGAGPSGNFFDQFDMASRGFPPAVPLPQPRPTLVQDAIPKIREGAQSLYQSVYENPMLGAEQKTAPHPELYGKPLSTNLEVNDAGEISYRDENGKLVPTDMSKHVFLKDAAGNPAVYQRSDATAESPVVGGARVLSLGLGPNAPTTAAIATAPSAVRPGVEATIPALKSAATAVYKNPEILARPVDRQLLTNAFNELAPDLRGADPRIVQRVSGELNDLGSGQGLTINDLNIASDRLGKIANETTGPAFAPKSTPDAAVATIVKKKIDAVMRMAAPEWETADANYAAQEAAKTIINRGDKATVQANRLGAGGDYAAKMSAQATTLLQQPKYLRGFKPDELEQLKAISEGTMAGDKLRSAQSWLSGRLAALAAMGAGLAGYEHSGFLGGAIGILGTGAVESGVGSVLTKLGNRLTANQVNTLSSSIRGRSPLAQQLQQQAADWDAAWKEVRATPNYSSLANLAQASRELSKQLGAVGVKLGPVELMRGAKPDENQ